MKRFRFLSILIIAIMLAGCGTETVNNSATAPGGTTGATVQATARPTDGYETQSIQTEGRRNLPPRPAIPRLQHWSGRFQRADARCF